MFIFVLLCYVNELTFGHTDHSICPVSADKSQPQLVSLIMAAVQGIYSVFLALD